MKRFWYEIKQQFKYFYCYFIVGHDESMQVAVLKRDILGVGCWICFRCGHVRADQEKDEEYVHEWCEEIKQKHKEK